MNRAVCVAALLLCGSVRVDAADADASRKTIRGALAFLDAGGATLEKGATCVNCHHAPLRSWSLREAAQAGLEIDAAEFRRRTDGEAKRMLDLQADYRGRQWDHSLSSLYALGEGRDDELGPGDELLDAFAKIIVSAQQADGSWQAAGQFGGQRRPAKDAGEAQTLWSVLALSRLAPREGTVAARDKALGWLKQKEPGATIDVRALRVLVAHRHGTAEERQAASKRLLDTQRPDGGWGWQPEDPSDAWATGLTLSALGRLGAEAPADAIATARGFLERTQLEDGSWLVQGKLKDNPKMASYFGTAWAIIGLSRTLPTTSE